MRTTVDGAGRLVVPKAIREQLGLRAGTEVEIEEHNGTVEIRPAPAEIEIVQTPEGPVATSKVSGPPLTDTAVRHALERVRG